MKIAFASCFDALKDAEQDVWFRVLDQKPEVLLLLGDSIYMDYFPKLGQSREWDLQKFADEMYRRYAAQWDVASFRELVKSVDAIGVTWDDHDFAWNGSCGAGQEKKTGVPYEKKLISQNLHLQFREQLRQRPLLSTYPPQPAMPDLLTARSPGIEESFDYGNVRCIMLDGRSYRQDQDDNHETAMLGITQKKWLVNQIHQWNGISLVCSGSTLIRSKESWDNYSDYLWLMNQGFDKTIVLSGDIHENAFRRHKVSQQNLIEITSSGAARPGIGGDEGNFGLLNIQPNEIQVTLFDEEGPEISKTLLI